MDIKIFSAILIIFGLSLFVSMGSQAALIVEHKDKVEKFNEATLYKVNVAGVVFCGVIAAVLIALGIALIMGKLTLN